MPGFSGTALGSAGRRAAGVVAKADTATVVPPVLYGPGSWTFVAPVAGNWTFRLRGASGTGLASGQPYGGGGGGGSFARRTTRLNKGQAVSLSIAFGGQGIEGGGASSDPSASTVTFPDVTMIAGAGQSRGSTGGAALGGTASGGDVNYPGGNGGSNYPATLNPTQAGGPKPGAVFNNPFGGGSTAGDSVMPGADGGNATTASIVNAPPITDGGGGGAYNASSGVYCRGADGGHARCLVTYEGP